MLYLQLQEYPVSVLSRIQGIPEVEDKANYFIEEDDAWNTFMTLIIIPHRELTNPQQHVIATDYGMEDGKLEIRIRGALVEYMLQMLNIDKQSAQRPAVQQQVEVLNFDDVKQYCFGS